MRLLELFSGTHSVGKVAKELGYDVVSLDIDGRADINCDIMEWDYTTYPVGHFDIVWGSFPCTTFSICRRSWINRKLKMFGDEVITKEILDKDMIDNGVPLLNKTIEIIDYFKPRLYFMENPKTGYAKNFIDKPFYDVDYCMYNYPIKKPTRIWTNKKNFVPLKCNHTSKHMSWEEFSKGGNKLDKRHTIPPKLIYDLLGGTPP